MNAFETQIATVLLTVCPRVFPDVAPVATAKPYITYQQIGGERLRNLNKTAADKRKVYLQVNVWSDSRLGANDLARQIEAAMAAATTFNAVEDSEPIWTHDDINLPDAPDGLYGCTQDFTVIVDR